MCASPVRWFGSNCPVLLPEVQPQIDTAKGGRSLGLATVPVNTLRENLKSATAALAEAFQDIRSVGDFKLAEIEIGIEINAEGGVRFIGTATVGGSGSITLKFAR